MCPAQVRQNVDLCTGHGGFPSRICDSASTNHTVNGKPVVRVGDHWVTHCDPDSCHDSVQATGSPNATSGGKARARVGDSIECGSSNMEGSSNCTVNGA
jgi:uncharacterized Zn-binding protein involved in type VI secretion